MTQRIPRRVGSWTATKLEQLSAYLEAFARATTRAGERYYIDAMAGCGECVLKATGAPMLGSAWRALNVEPPFTGIHLVELDQASATHLRDQTVSFGEVSVYQGDCNIVIPERVLPRISRVAPTLAFLDSTGVEPTWKLLHSLAAHRRGRRGEKIELLILFAFDMFINRWLKLERMADRLTAFFGSTRWEEELRASISLKEELDARRTRFLNLYLDGLRTELKYAYVRPFGPLKNGRRALYHMVFATDHPVADRIMSDVWEKHRDIPGSLFYYRAYKRTPPGWTG